MLSGARSRGELGGGGKMPMKKHGWRCPKCRMKCGFDMKPGKKKIAISGRSFAILGPRGQ
jgi:hypothetical protein